MIAEKRRNRPVARGHWCVTVKVKLRAGKGSGMTMARQALCLKNLMRVEILRLAALRAQQYQQKHACDMDKETWHVRGSGQYLTILRPKQQWRIASGQKVGNRFAVAGMGLALYDRCERPTVLPGGDVS